MSVKGNFSNSVGFTPPGAGVQMSVSPAPSAAIYLFAKCHSTGCSGRGFTFLSPDGHWWRPFQGPAGHSGRTVGRCQCEAGVLRACGYLVFVTI